MYDTEAEAEAAARYWERELNADATCPDDEAFACEATHLLPAGKRR